MRSGGPVNFAGAGKSANSSDVSTNDLDTTSPDCRLDRTELDR